MTATVAVLNELGQWLFAHLGRMSIELAILTAIVFVALRLLRVKSPALRHLFWGLLLAKPVATFLIASPLSLYAVLWPPAPPAPPAINVPVSMPSQIMEEPQYDSPADSAPNPSAPAVASPPPTPSPPPFWRQIDRYGLISLAWIALAGALGLRLLIGCAYVALLRHTAIPQREGLLGETLTEAARVLRVRRKVCIATTRVAHGPVLAGIFHPIILLPDTIAAALTPKQIKLVVSHELAHARRWDNLVLLIQRLAEMFLFFHPVVWFCGWMMRREAESACDDMVISAYNESDSAVAYADSLTRVAEMRCGITHRLLVNTFAAAESNFTSRIRRILNTRRQRITLRFALAIGVTLILLAALGLPTVSIAPKTSDDTNSTLLVLRPDTGKLDEQTRTKWQADGITSSEQMQAKLQEETIRVIEKRLKTAKIKDVTFEKQKDGSIQLRIPTETTPEQTQQINAYATQRGVLSLHRVADDETLMQTLEKLKAASQFKDRLFTFVDTKVPELRFGINEKDYDSANTLLQEINQTSGLVPDGYLLGIAHNRYDHLHPLYLFNKQPEWKVQDVIKAGALPYNEAPGTYSVMIALSKDEGNRLGQVTEKTIGHPIALVMDGDIQSAPTIQSRITTSVMMVADYTQNEARDIATMLASGTLPAPVVAEEPEAKASNKENGVSNVNPQLTFRGRVIDTDGKPIPGARVESQGAWIIQEPVISNQDGRFEVLIPSYCSMEYLSVLPTMLKATHPDTPDLLGRLNKKISSEADLQGDIVLRPTGSIQGKVVWEGTGKPVTHVKVDAVPYPDPQGITEDAETDDTGVFQIKRLMPGKYRINVLSFKEGVIHSRLVEVASPTAITGQDLTATKGVLVSGKFLKPDTQETVTDMRLGAISENFTSIIEVKADGTFEGVLPPGSITLDAIICSTIQEKSLPPKHIEKTLIVVEGQPQTDILFEVNPPPVFKGRVLDSDGKPVAGATIYNFNNKLAKPVISNPDGSFEYSLPSRLINGNRFGGSFSLEASHPDRPGLRGLLNKNISSEADLTGDIALTPTGSIQGKIIWEGTGEAVKHVSVMAITEKSIQATTFTEGRGTGTDDKGVFLIKDLIPGKYQLKVESFKEGVVSSKTIELAPGANLTGQDLTVTKGVLVSGKVLKSYTKEPADGVVMLQAKSKNNPYFNDAIGVNHDGTFERCLPLGEITLYTSIQNGQQSQKIEKTLNLVEGQSQPDIIFDIKEFVFKGRVLNQEGKPVGGAQVKCKDQDDIAPVISNQEGYFIVPIRSYHPQWSFFITASHPDMPGLCGALDKSGNREEELNGDIVLLPSGIIRGKITDKDGKPVVSAKVTAYLHCQNSVTPNNEVICENTGQFEIQNIFGGMNYSLSATAPGKYGEATSVDQKIEPGKTWDVGTLVLPVADKVIEGTVKDETGNPLAGMEVLSWGKGTGTRIRKSDDKGQFRIENVVENDVIQISATTYDQKIQLHAEVSAKGGDTNVEIILKPQGNQAAKPLDIAGIVVDEAGKPISDARVVIFKLESDGRSQIVQEIKSAADGKFAIKLMESDIEIGHLSINTTHADYGISVLGGNTLVQAGKKITDLRIEMAKRGSIQGKVINTENKPVKDAAISVLLFKKARKDAPTSAPDMQFPDHCMLGAMTDVNGVFKLDGLPQDATLIVRANHPDYAVGLAGMSSSRNSFGHMGTIAVGSTDTLIKLQPGASIEGKVVTEGTGESVAHIPVVATPEDRTGFAGPDVVITDEKGVFLIKSLAPGNYSLQGQPYGGWVGIHRKVEVTQVGKITGQDVTVVKGVRFTGRFVNADTKEPLRGYLLAFSENDKSRAEQFNAKSDGTFEGCMLPGEVSLTAFIQNGSPVADQIEQKLTLVAGQDQSNIVFEAKPSLIFKGRVLDPEGKPVPRAKVVFKWGLDEKSVLTNQEGVFEYSLPTFVLKQASVTFEAYHPDNPHLFGTLEKKIAGDEDLKGDIVLSPAGIIRGNVVDKNRKPVPFARVNAYNLIDSRSMNDRNTMCDDSGQFEINGAVGGANYVLFAKADKHGQARAERAVLEPGATWDVGTLELPVTDKRIEGTVKDEGGNPVANVRIRCTGHNTGSSDTQSDEKGHFRFEYVADESIGINAWNEGPKGRLHAEVSAKGGDTNLELILKPETNQAATNGAKDVSAPTASLSSKEPEKLASAITYDNLPDAKTLREGLVTAFQLIKSVRFSAVLSHHISVATGEWSGTETPFQNLTVVKAGDSFYERSSGYVNANEEQLFVSKADITKLWLRNNDGPGIGKIRKTDSQELVLKTYYFSPLFCMNYWYSFEPTKTDFKVVGRSLHHDIPIVIIEWSDQNEKGENQAHYTAKLFTDGTFLPVYVEKQEHGSVVRSMDVFSICKNKDGAAIPADITFNSKSTFDAVKDMESRAMFPPAPYREKEIVLHSHYVLRDIALNGVLDEKQFEIRWTEGTEVIDETTGISHFNHVEKIDSLPVPLVFRGRVLDADGKPLAGAEVISKVGDEKGPARSNGSGLFEITLCPQAREVPNPTVTYLCGLQALHPERPGLRGLLIKPLKTDAEFTGDIVLTPVGTLRGRVLDKDGKPVPEAQVQTMISTDKGEIADHTMLRCNPKGAFEVKDVPGGMNYYVKAKSKGYGWNKSSPFMLKPGAVQDVTLVLPVAEKLIEGTVKRETGETVSGARISILVSGAGEMEVFSDVKGHFSLDNWMEEKVERSALKGSKVEIGASYLSAKGQLSAHVSAKGGDTNIELILKPETNPSVPNISPNTPAPVTGAPAVNQSVQPAVNPNPDTANTTVIAGIVVDEAGGPIANATVVVQGTTTNTNGKAPVRKETRSGVDGKFSLTLSENKKVLQEFTITTIQSQYGISSFHAIRETFVGNPLSECRIVLPKRGSIQGKVVDAANKPVKDAQISVILRSPTRMGLYPILADESLIGTKTGVDGAFQVDGLPQGGSVILRARHPDYPISFNNTANVGSTDVMITLLTGGTITGKIAWEKTGVPVRKVKVQLRYYGRVFEAPEPAETDENGVFTFRNVASEKGVLSVESFSEGIIAPVTVDIGPNASITGINLIAMKGVHIAGKCIKADTKEPVAEGKIRITPTGHDLVIKPDGTFEGLLPRGEAKIEREISDHFVLSDQAPMKLLLVNGQDQTNLVFEVIPSKPFLVLKGRVLGVDGKPLAGAKVFSMYHDTDKPVISNQEGRFEYPLPIREIQKDQYEGGIILEASHPDLPGIRGVLGKAIHSENDLSGDIVMTPIGTIRGKVYDKEGKPIPTAMVRAVLQFKDEATSLQFDRSVRCDSAGQFEIKDAVGGHIYSVTAYADKYRQQQISPKPLARSMLLIEPENESKPSLTPIEPGKTWDVGTVVLLRADLVVEGTVKDENGKPVAAAQLRCWTDDDTPGNDVKNTMTNEKGHFQFKYIVDGSVKISAAGDGAKGPLHAEVSAKGGDTNVELILKPESTQAVPNNTPNTPAPVTGAPAVNQSVQPAVNPNPDTANTTNIAGVVVNEAGKPVENARVVIYGYTSTQFIYDQGLASSKGETKSDRDGKFTITVTEAEVWPQRFQVVVIHPDYGIFIQDSKNLNGGGKMLSDCRFMLAKRGFIQGKVVDFAGKPVKDAEVTVIFTKYNEMMRTQLTGLETVNRSLLNTKTGADGMFTLDGLSENNRMVVRATHPDYVMGICGLSGTQDSPKSMGVIATGSTDTVIMLQPGATVEGRITWEGTGMPVENVTVMAFQEAKTPFELPSPVVTDSQGHFIIKSVPLGKVILANRSFREGIITPKWIEVTQSATLTGQNLTATKGVRIAGKFVKAGTLEPVKGGHIFGTRPTNLQSGINVDVKPDGSFEGHGTPGEVTLHVSNSSGDLMPDQEQKNLTLVAGQDQTDLVFEVKVNPPLFFKGRVVGIDGKPIAGVRIFEKKSFGQTVISNSEGLFEYPIPRYIKQPFRDVIFEALHPDKPGLRGILRKNLLAEGGLIGDIVMISVGTIRGKVQDRKGQPVPAAKVEAILVGGGWNCFDRVVDCDELGQYEIKDAIGGADYYVTVKTPGNHGNSRLDREYGMVRSVALRVEPGATSEFRPVELPLANKIIK